MGEDILTQIGSLELLASSIRNAIKSIREEKVRFWKELLERYREDKEAFDYEFKMITERNAEMERRASKLTSGDFKDLIWKDSDGE